MREVKAQISQYRDRSIVYPCRGDEMEPQNLGWKLTLKQNWKLVMIGVIISFLVRLPISYIHAHQPMFGDQGLYDELARSLANGQGFSLEGEASSDRSPGYPAFLALIYRFVSTDLFTVYAIQSIISSLCCGFVILLAMRLSNNRMTAIISGLMMAFYLPIALLDTLLLTEVLFLPFTLLVIAFTEVAVRSQKWQYWVMAGLSTGLACYIRPTAFVFPMMVFVVALISKMPLKRAIIGSVACFVAAYVVLCPWMIRNKSLFGEFTPLPSESGYTLYYNWSLNIPNMYSLKLSDFPKSEASLIGNKTAYARDKVLLKLALKHISENKALYVKSGTKKIFRQWMNLFWRNSPSSSSVIFAVVNFFLLVLAMISLKERKISLTYRVWTVLSMLYITTAAILISSAEPRFTYWIMPFLFILAANTLVTWTEQYRQHRI